MTDKELQWITVFAILIVGSLCSCSFAQQSINTNTYLSLPDKFALSSGLWILAAFYFAFVLHVFFFLFNEAQDRRDSK